jgi:hypothetical protein
MGVMLAIRLLLLLLLLLSASTHAATPAAGPAAAAAARTMPVIHASKHKRLPLGGTGRVCYLHGITRGG